MTLVRLSAAACAVASLSVLGGCGGETTPAQPETVDEGTLRVTVQTIGLDLDGDGYEVSTDGGSASVATNGEAIFTLPPGQADVSLSGQAPNCVPDRTWKVSTVTAGQAAELLFVVTCLRDPILFQRTAPNGTRGIWVTDASGSVDAVPLVTGSAERGPLVEVEARQFAWSPDRLWVAYILEDLDFRLTQTLNLIALNKSESRTLEGVGPQGSPVFSPDGTRLAFLESGPQRQRDLVHTDLEGQGRSVVFGGDLYFTWDPMWSGVNDQIVFTGKRLILSPARSGVWVASGGAVPAPEQHTFGLARLQADEASNEDWHMDARLSPDGTRVLFRREEWGSGEVDLYTVPVGEPRAITPVLENPAASDFYARWSPDGERIAWSQCSSGCPTRELPIEGALATTLWIMNADGSAPTLLSETGGGWGLSWNADEDLQGGVVTAPQITYSASSTGSSSSIYVIPATGGSPVQLTEGAFTDIHPLWRP